MFKCEFSTDNGAFEDSRDGRLEVRRILRDLGDRMELGPHVRSGPIFDINGNKIGAWSLTED